MPEAGTKPSPEGAGQKPPEIIGNPETAASAEKILPGPDFAGEQKTEVSVGPAEVNLPTVTEPPTMKEALHRVDSEKKAWGRDLLLNKPDSDPVDIQNAQIEVKAKDTKPNE
ncbi:MAG: hypothetical protein HY398_01135 [Candidatus Doudnabacteria bacterium]|nr:hypothetical protein [Candidatus Doudnabacteria bacterium]